MSTTTDILTIRANTETQKKFKESWRKFNEARLGTVTQAEYLEYILDNYNKKED